MRTGGGALATLERVARVGVLIPATLACAAVADLALRALPHDRFSFRAWEAVRTPGEDAPFLPNTRYHNDRTYGNLSAIGNIPAARRYRSVTLTTDALGYANPPGLGPPGGGGGRGRGGGPPRARVPGLRLDHPARPGVAARDPISARPEAGRGRPVAAESLRPAGAAGATTRWIGDAVPRG